MKNTTYKLETMSCPSCVQKIEGMLKKTDGINTSEVLFNSSRVKVEHDDTVVSADTIAQQIEDLGFPVISHKSK